VVDVRGMRGLKVATVYPGTAAEKVGLRTGDVIRSINGYRTERPDNVTWILTNAPPGTTLAITLQGTRDGAERVVKAELP
jgi:S1-C subfamily serine protease